MNISLLAADCGLWYIFSLYNHTCPLYTGDTCPRLEQLIPGSCQESHISIHTGLIPGVHSANERRCYKVTPSLIGWAQTKMSPVHKILYRADSRLAPSQWEKLLQSNKSVRPSVCPSVTPFSPCSHHRIIMKFSGVVIMVRSDVHAKGQGQRSKVKVTEVNTQLSRFRTLTPVWIHIWQWNHAHSWKQHRRGALLFFKVISKISRSHGSKNRRIRPKLGLSGL